MKHIIIILGLLFVLPLASRAADDTQALFEKGNAQYTKADYKGAVASYQKILSQGYQSATIYFNLGNAYYKLDEIPSALLYFEKARKLTPGDEDINFNIQLANLKTTDKIDETPQFFVTKWWYSFILMFPIGTIAALAIVLFIAGFGVLSYYLFAQSSTLKRAAFYTAMALIFLGLLTSLIGNRQVSYFAAHQQAIIFGNSVTVRSEPVSSSKNLFVIHEGTKVDVTARNNDWIKIKLANGNEGWIVGADAKDI